VQIKTDVLRLEAIYCAVNHKLRFVRRH